MQVVSIKCSKKPSDEVMENCINRNSHRSETFSGSKVIFLMAFDRLSYVYITLVW